MLRLMEKAFFSSASIKSSKNVYDLLSEKEQSNFAFTFRRSQFSTTTF